MQELHPNPLIVTLEPTNDYVRTGQKPVERIIDEAYDRYDGVNN
jgi:hypothetical protein